MKALRDALYSTLRLIDRHAGGFFTALAAFFTVGFLLALAAVAMFAALASAVGVGFTQSMDEAVLHWFAAHRSPLLDKIMLEVSTLGTGIVLTMIVLVASVFLWQTQHKWSVYVLLIGTIGGRFVNTFLKEFFNRPRPTIVEWATTVHTTSFPSGHAMTSLVTYGSVAYLVGRLEPSARLERITWIIATAIVIAIGFSRMYLGVHYPSDVIAGFIAGLAWLAFVIALVKAVQFFASRRPETQQEEQSLHK
jgi:undecaprenyl-diphosphatase